MEETLFEQWAPTFDKKTVDSELGASVASGFCSKFNFDLLNPITVESSITFLKLVLHSAPGPDGIPYIA